MAVSHFDVACMNTFASKGESAMKVRAECATFHKNILYNTILGRSIGVDSFPSFDAHTVIITIQIAVADNDIGAYIKINGIA